MVTSHFYELDAAVAQLLFSLQTADDTTSHNAASELAVSQPDLLYRALCFAWWLQSPDHPLQAARAAAFVAQDSHALYSALEGSPFEIPAITEPVTAAEKPKTLKMALKKRQWQQVYCAARTLSYTELLTIGVHQKFIDAIQTTIYKPLEYRILAHACAALTAYESLAPSTAPWSRHPSGSRAGRTFMCLPAAFSAWQVKRKPPTGIQGDPHKLIPKQLFETEEQEIEYYVTHFPDDIPDEWPEEEILKSHGPSLVYTERNPWRPAFLDCF
jgi:hypothetical protein